MLFQSANEFAVGEFFVHSIKTRVDANVPKSSEVVLLIFAVGERILAGMRYRFLRRALFFGACKAVALHALQYVPAGFRRCCSSFYSCHK